jgi:hypothetical protein
LRRPSAGPRLLPDDPCRAAASPLPHLTVSRAAVGTCPKLTRPTTATNPLLDHDQPTVLSY